MVNLSEAKEIRAPALSRVERSGGSHRCRVALFIAQEDVAGVCRGELAGREEGGNDGSPCQQSRALEMLAAILNHTQDKKLILGAGERSL
jgi:hypothetical protein